MAVVESPRLTAIDGTERSDVSIMVSMKKLIFVAILLALLLPVPIHAQEIEAGSAAQLAFTIATEDTRVAHLESYLSSFNSPLAKDAKHIVAEADRLGLDWKLIPAIAGVESTFCRQIPSGSYNCWGWGIPSGAQSGIAFQSYARGVTTVSEGLKFRYINRGAVTIEQIGRIYAASPVWSYKVRYFLTQIESFRPSSPNLLDVTI